MVFSNLKNARRHINKGISVQAAHTLWRLAMDRYVLIDLIIQHKNFLHDKDFLIYLNNLVEELKKDTDILENKLEKFNIPAPEPNYTDQNITMGSTEPFTDRGTAENIYAFMRLDMQTMLVSMIEMYKDDNIRDMLVDFKKNSFQRLNSHIKYMKVKEWIQFPPMYPYVQPDVKEKVSANEIFLLWELLVYRYHNKRLTIIFSNFVTDPEFKAILTYGTKILSRQIKDLENKLLYFGARLPKSYSSVSPSTEKAETMEDKFMFNILLRNMQDSVIRHGLASVDVIVNDALRKYFMDLNMQELDNIDSLIKYGKVKGWSYISPPYKAPV